MAGAFCVGRLAWASAAAALMSGCGGGSGSDGSELPVAYPELRNGIVFSTRAIRGSAGYDLYWIPFPSTAVTGVLPAVRLTDSIANEKQPAVAKNGLGMAFASDDGIHVISAPEGRIRRISDTSGTTFLDSHPSLSPRADRVAWVREDTSKPIGESGFFQSWVMIADFDGANVREVNPKPGVVQDSPVFDPSDDPKRTRLAWTEFAGATVVPGGGPTDYGVAVFDYGVGTGTFACRSENGATPGTGGLPPREWPYRCFGQHLAWPTEDVLVLPQDMLEISLSGQGLTSIWGTLVDGVQQQQLGIAQIGARPDGFFPAFPLSVSYTADLTKMVFDGVMTSIEGDAATLAIMVANSDGSGVFRVQIGGYVADLDTATTHNYLFSVATPRVIPFF